MYFGLDYIAVLMVLLFIGIIVKQETFCLCQYERAERPTGQIEKRNSLDIENIFFKSF